MHPKKIIHPYDGEHQYIHFATKNSIGLQGGFFGATSALVFFIPTPPNKKPYRYPGKIFGVIKTTSLCVTRGCPSENRWVEN